MLRQKSQEKFVVKRIDVVHVCAWCSDETYPTLDDYQAYSHGICTLHLKRMRHELREMDASP